MISPDNLLRIYSKKFPKAWKAADRMRQLKGHNGIPEWPGWCFVPSLGWREIVTLDKPHLSLSNAHLEYTPEIMSDRLRVSYEADCACALGAWRPSKGVYRFEPEVLDCLLRTPLSGNMPTEVLFRLPAWCVFINIHGSGLTYDTSLINGFFVSVDYDFDNKKTYLMLVLDLTDKAELAVLRLPMGQHSVLDALAELLEEFEKIKKQALMQGIEVRSKTERSCERAADEVLPLLSLIVYICSDKPDLGVKGQGMKIKGLPKVPKGATVTPEAPRVTYYTVGSKIARAIRKAEAEADEDANDHKSKPEGKRAPSSRRPHFRQAHWHHFWTGPREPREGEERKLVVKFLLPMLVRGNDKTAENLSET